MPKIRVSTEAGQLRLRFRLLQVAGRLVRTAHREWLRLPRGWPWNPILLAGHDRLAALTT